MSHLRFQFPYKYHEKGLKVAHKQLEAKQATPHEPGDTFSGENNL